MSLTGNLEDLGLGEILQIVSLSRKTGVLSIHSRGREGTIIFRQGQVVRASSSTFQRNLGEVLIQRGVIDLAVLRKALASQQEQGFRERLGVILIRQFAVPREVIEDVVSEQIESIVFSLFAWVEGTFEFAVSDSVETVDGTRLDPLQFMLDHQGLNPQFLAMEGTRIQDEKRYAAGQGMAADDAAHEDDLAFDLIGEEEQPAAMAVPEHAPCNPVVIVDDDASTLLAAAGILEEAGYEVHSLSRSEDTLIRIDTIYRGGARPTVLIDLIMPRMDGSGVLGGMELLEILHNNFKDIPILVMSDYHHADAESRIREMGYPFFVKPRRVEIGTASAIEGFTSCLLAGIRGGQPDGEARPSAPHQDRFNLGDELRLELGDGDHEPPAFEAPAASAFSLLRGMLEELNSPELLGGVVLLVLRFASEFLNRAVVFHVSNGVVSGAGQFGIWGGPAGGDETVRGIQFPLGSPSMFDEVYREGVAMRFTPSPSPVDRRIFEQLGGGIPAEVFIGPIKNGSKTVGFIYGDNLPVNAPVGDTESLEIFLSQAGIAMEKFMLERQLNERAQQ